MPEPDAPSLDDTQIEMLAEALESWAKNHPRPEMPVIGFAEGPSLAPSQVANEVRKRSEAGLKFIRMVRFGMEVRPFEQIVRSFSGVFRERL